MFKNDLQGFLEATDLILFYYISKLNIYWDKYFKKNKQKFSIVLLVTIKLHWFHWMAMLDLENRPK